MCFTSLICQIGSRPNEKISRSVAIGWIDWCTPGMGVSLRGDLPSPKATARQEVPCTRTYGVHTDEYYQKYEPKARAGGRPTV